MQAAQAVEKVARKVVVTAADNGNTAALTTDTEGNALMGDFNERVYRTVSLIPEGRVASYGQIARMVGAPRCARFVGYALHANPEPGIIPCQRVVFADGRICEGYAFGGPDVQRAMLEEEGVAFVDEMHVDMESCRWNPESDGKGPAIVDDGTVLPTRPTDIDWSREMDG